MASNKKFEEGLEHIKNAEKCMKTSLLKWRPDYDIAADEYQKAATCFRVAKSFEQCKDCLMKAADSNKQNRSFFHAAKNYEQAILVCKELGDLRDVQKLAEKSCHLYQQHGSCDSAAMALDKGAKIIEGQYPEQALQLYQRAADVVMLEDNARLGSEYASKVARIMVKLGMYDQATDAIRREIGLLQQTESTGSIGRLAVALVLVQLARGDTVAAEKAFKEWGNCCDPQEVQTLEQLLQGFDEEDPEMAARALSSSFIKHMDVEYSRLARDLPLPRGTAPLSKASVIEKAAPSYISPNKGGQAEEGAAGGADNDDDEGGFGLC
ncbi:gamma-soluble NSF attachment protein-like [Neocloeon triangulifer]|uniref:gamma-soluble NSF attachment protein-like n=1 Tax=Neocloeon triangulifer TaxID=2078957 RepID=UPI00286F0987|nr:gamma-soluble NSF attachment protein-like [Neocloeon triangulifer]